jgi:hypothetical protein
VDGGAPLARTVCIVDDYYRIGGISQKKGEVDLIWR